MALGGAVRQVQGALVWQQVAQDEQEQERAEDIA